MKINFTYLFYQKKGDKLPPVVISNNQLRVYQGQSGFLTKYELNVKDDDTQMENLKFYITTQPKIGYLENINVPGRFIFKKLYKFE